MRRIRNFLTKQEAITVNDAPFEKSHDSHDKPLSYYLQANEINIRQCVYISREMQQRVATIVNLLPNSKVTIGGYIDRVLSEHFKTHKDEINAFYCKQRENFIKE